MRISLTVVTGQREQGLVLMAVKYNVPAWDDDNGSKGFPSICTVSYIRKSFLERITHSLQRKQGFGRSGGPQKFGKQTEYVSKTTVYKQKHLF
jgi:hypothetical protein